MNRNIETVIESLLPALYTLQGDPETQAIAHQAATNLVFLIDADAFRERRNHPATEFLNVIATDPSLLKRDLEVANTLVAAIDSRSECARLSYPELAETTGMAIGAVRGSISRLTSAGYFRVLYPSANDFDSGDLRLRYQPDMRARIFV